MSKIYSIGFEDGLAGAVCNDSGFDSKQAFEYRNGFAAGVKAAEKIG